MIRKTAFMAARLGLALAALATGASLGARGVVAAIQPESPPAVRANDPWKAGQVIRPAELASLLKAKGEHPLLFHVGFQRLYRAGAIPGSRYAGPGSTPEGIAGLQEAAKALPRNRSIVLYCGCCPWDHCPNMRPAFRALTAMGFKRVRALYIAKNLESDWVDKGYPIEKPAE